MKSDLDRLMGERGFDAIVVMGPVEGNHALNYLAGGAEISEGIVIKKRGDAPCLIVGAMERDEAAKSGLFVRTYNDFDLYNLAKEAGSYFEGRLRMIAAIFERYEIKGTVSFYGMGDTGRSFIMLSRLSKMLPGITITGEAESTIFEAAYATKDAGELARLKSVAERTNTVVDETVKFLQSHAVEDARLVKADGSPLTIGDVKQLIRARLLHYKLEEDHGTIFAIGHDAGVPHSRGEDADPVELGRSIIFDIFPREMGGGYFHDMTRTFCLGYAPPEVQHAYDQVMLTFNEVMKQLAVGEKTAHYQDLTCDLLEEMGHPTIRKDPSTVEGYVHSLGHGIGLQLHSSPSFNVVSQDMVQIGQVFTVEPGVYYPSRGFGIRIEDTVYVDEQGRFHSLTTYPKDLVIPVGDGAKDDPED